MMIQWIIVWVFEVGICYLFVDLMWELFECMQFECIMSDEILLGNWIMIVELISFGRVEGQLVLKLCNFGNLDVVFGFIVEFEFIELWMLKSLL